MVEQTDQLTRAEFSKLKFEHIISKAFRKGKLNKLLLPLNDKHVAHDSIIIEPALYEFKYSCGLADGGTAALNPIVYLTHYVNSDDMKRLKSSKVITGDSLSPHYSIDRRKFQDDNDVEKSWEFLSGCTVESVWWMIMGADPTPNKEYAQWILSIYNRILKDRTPLVTLGDNSEYRIGTSAYAFFEDLPKLHDSLKVFHKIKNSKVLTVEQRDIYSYKSINKLVETVFLAHKEETGQSLTDILSAKELEQIANGNAIIEHQDSDWIIVHTVEKEANQVFGCNTTWCTAGDRYGSMFEHYNKTGKLFILVKNQPGASSHLKTNPNNRYQFHFESEQYRNVTNNQTSITEFFNNFLGVKSYFRGYILETVKSEKDLNKIINTLSKFGYIKDLIPILKENKTKVLDLTNLVSKNNQFDLNEIGEIETLEELTIRDGGLTTIPAGISRLTCLKILRLTGHDFTEVPEWIGNMKSLRKLILTKNNINKPFDVTNLTELVELNVGLNKKLTEMPKGIGNLKKLWILDMYFCNIKEVGNDILDCSALVTVNFAKNLSLKRIPDDIVNLPKLLSLLLDDTNIPISKISELKQLKKNKNTLLT